MIHIESKAKGWSLCDKRAGDDELAMENFPDVADCIECLQKKVREQCDELFKIKMAAN